MAFCVLQKCTRLLKLPAMKTATPKIRLFVTDALGADTKLTLSRDQSHYVSRVMRQAVGDQACVFNGRDGEWLAQIEDASKTACRLSVSEQTRPQSQEPDIWLAFSPIKKSRLDFLVEKAVELGVSRLLPVITERTDVSRVNVDRLSATAMEAAEQCERLSVPKVDGPLDLRRFLEQWPPDRQLFVMDETGQGTPAAQAFSATAAAILVGPEGGFSTVELDALRDLPFVTPVSLGPRVLRAETAALTALACWQALAGDGCEVRRR